MAIAFAKTMNIPYFLSNETDQQAFINRKATFDCEGGEVSPEYYKELHGIEYKLSDIN